MDGRDVTDCNVVYAATALSVMDGVLRSGFLPKLFTTFYFDDKDYSFLKGDCPIEDQVEIMTGVVLNKYIEILGGDLYIKDILSLVNMFLKSKNSISNDFFDAKLIIGNTVLSNSRLVGGADFDCIFKCNDKLILTDIKTTIKPLRLEHLRQVIGYALLYNEERDDFIFSDIGIYHSRSGSFCFLPLDDAIKMVFPTINSTKEARQKFVMFLEETIEQERRNREELLAIELAKQETLKQKRKLARLTRLAKAKSITVSECENLLQEKDLAKEKIFIEREQARIMNERARQERALVKEKSRIEREHASIARANKRRENEKCRREKAIARRLARQLNQDVDNSK